MRRIGTLLVAAAAFGAVAAPRLFAGDGPAAPAASPEEVAEAKRLVEDLGSADFRVREAATKALMGLGEKARPALEAAVKRENPAVRFRADQLLQRLDGTKGEQPLGDGSKPDDAARKGMDAKRRQLEESMRGLRERWGAGRFDEQLKELEKQMEEFHRQLEQQFGAAGGGFGPDVQTWVRRFGGGGPGAGGLELFPGLLAARRALPDLVQATDAGTWTLRERPGRTTLTFRPKADPSATAVYTARDVGALLAAWPDLKAQPGVGALLERSDARRAEAERAEAEARKRAETPGATSPSVQRSVQIESTPDHVKVTVTETGPDGKTVTKSYEGKDLETLKAQHPELEGVVGGMTFRFHTGPGGFGVGPNGGVIFGPGAGPRPLEDDEDAPSDLDDDAEPATGPFGLALAPVPDDLRAHLGVAEGRGALVMAVRAGSDAEKLGLRVHDVILKVNGADVKALEDVGAAIRAVPAGGALALEVQRGGASVTLTR